MKIQNCYLIFVLLLVACHPANINEKSVQKTTTMLNPTVTYTPVNLDLPSEEYLDWELFESDRVALWLPQKFEERILTSQDIRASGEKIASLDETWIPVVKYLPQERLEVVVESEAMLVIVMESPKVMPIRLFLRSASHGLPPHSEIITQESFEINDYQVGKLVIETNVLGLNIEQTIYALKQGYKEMWTVSYASLEPDKQNQNIIENSIQSFKIKGE